MGFDWIDRSSNTPPPSPRTLSKPKYIRQLKSWTHKLLQLKGKGSPHCYYVDKFGASKCSCKVDYCEKKISPYFEKYD